MAKRQPAEFVYQMYAEIFNWKSIRYVQIPSFLKV